MIDDNEILSAFNEAGSKAAAARLLGLSRSAYRRRFDKINESSTFLEDASETLGFPTEAVSSYWVKSSTGSFHVKMDKHHEDIADYFKQAFLDIKDKSIVTPPPLVDADLMNIYPIADLHVGMLSWSAETDEDYDIRIVEHLAYDSFEKLFDRSPNAGTALIEQLGDFFHSNDYKNMTPASGNILDVDTRYQKMIYVGARIMKNIIERALEKHEKVIVRNVAGNHDPASMVALNIALSMYYGNNPRVIIEDSPRQLWAMLFGNTLIGCHHGHMMKADRAAMALACSYPEEWGKSKFRTIHSGHIHHTKVIEVGNVLCESFQTLAAKDSYAASHGYISGRSLQSITIHKELGEVGRSRVNM